VPIELFAQLGGRAALPPLEISSKIEISADKEIGSRVEGRRKPGRSRQLERPIVLRRPPTLGIASEEAQYRVVVAAAAAAAANDIGHHE
jgi:hypothetical protein